MNKKRAGASTRLYPEGTPVSYWLIPSSPDKELFKKTIELLAGEMRGPQFDPHITLFSGVLADGEDPGAVLAHASARFEPLHLTCGQTAHSGLLFKTLYIDFSYQSVAPLANAIRDRSRRQSSYRFEPHLSLLYAGLPTDVRQRLADEVSFSGKRVQFGEIAAIVPGDGQTDFQQVAGWQVCARRPLALPISMPAQDKTPETPDRNGADT
jgi:hypothetical protein